ncbi:HOG (high osmolarity glycerol) pathway protein [Trapelia coarctata]|nr:HOG (high osmolarity glycerol) pathway protein [Trapelia coarctata]
MAYGDDHGPPYSEDEDLHSPVVVSSRHKKNKSAFPNIAGGFGKGRGRSPGRSNGAESSRQAGTKGDRTVYTGANGDGSETYYVSGAGDDEANGPGGEIITYPPDHARYSNSMLYPNTYHSPRQGGDPSNPRSSMYDNTPSSESSGLEPGRFSTDESRYSRDYQFTIASPDEEMHGKAVALFDFARENENELPLVEGQVIWVSYRHGQGWLVAEDPKTRESGLVPEEYVRLLRDIEGGWGSLSGEHSAATEQGMLSPDASGPGDGRSAVTPTQEDSGYGHSAQGSNGSNSRAAGGGIGVGGVGTGEKRPSVVSVFSTSRDDLNPYPHPLFGTQTGMQPPQVVHYGSTSNTPTVLSPANVGKGHGEGGKVGEGSASGKVGEAAGLRKAGEGGLRKSNSGSGNAPLAKRHKVSDTEEEEEDETSDEEGR